jgi:hypothetical protein
MFRYAAFALRQEDSTVIIGNFILGIGEAIWDIGILALILRLSPGREAATFGLHMDAVR